MPGFGGRLTSAVETGSRVGACGRSLPAPAIRNARVRVRFALCRISRVGTPANPCEMRCFALLLSCLPGSGGSFALAFGRRGSGGAFSAARSALLVCVNSRCVCFAILECVSSQRTRGGLAIAGRGGNRVATLFLIRFRCSSRSAMAWSDAAGDSCIGAYGDAGRDFGSRAGFVRGKPA